MIDELALQFPVKFDLLGYLLSLVQFGFIVGSLTFAILTIVDRFSPSRVFLISAILGGLCNLALLIPNIPLVSLLSARFGTGFFLAGIYPVGMKIASDYYKNGLGKALGYLVGALVLGTALPHLLKELSWNSDYTTVLVYTSLLSFIGGSLIHFLIPDGPYRKPVNRFKYSGIIELFANPGFKRASFGYFGHMWELYAFWGFVPLILKTFRRFHYTELSVPLWSFIVIGIGCISCILGGYISLRTGSKKVAQYSLFLSGLLCLCSPFLFKLPEDIFLTLLCIWGMVVISDSPQFSNIVAETAKPSLRGTGLIIVNCIGYTITIISIQLLSFLSNTLPPEWIFIFLAIGPVFGVVALMRR